MFVNFDILMYIYASIPLLCAIMIHTERIRISICRMTFQNRRHLMHLNPLLFFLIHLSNLIPK